MSNRLECKGDNYRDGKTIQYYEDVAKEERTEIKKSIVFQKSTSLWYYPTKSINNL